MTIVSVLEFRKDAAGIIRRLKKGQRMVLSYRGRPVARLEPVGPETVSGDDPIYALAGLAMDGGVSLSNREMDEVIYGERGVH